MDLMMTMAMAIMSDLRDDFYCRYGNHWKPKELKIPTARQSHFICAECEERRRRQDED
jgi:hypothetical protein